MLYPYRATSTKNVQRWNFGTLYPRDYAEIQQPMESFRMVAECLIKADGNATIDVRARFLQLIRRQEHASKVWDEGVERSCDFKQLLLRDLSNSPLQRDFSFDQSDEHEGKATKVISGRLILKAETRQLGIHKLSLELTNITSVANPSETSRSEAMLQSFVSAHSLLGIE